MGKLFYPAVFHEAEEGGYWITFPDFPGCFSQGETMEETYEMAIDALGLCISDIEKDKNSLPVPTTPIDIPLENKEAVVIIEFDVDAYRRKHNSRAVKKTLTIPEWLNEEAMALGINFSQVLQEALLQKLPR